MKEDQSLEGLLPVSPFQSAFKIINFRELFGEDLPLALWFLTYMKGHAVVPLSFVLAGWIARLGQLEKN